MKLISQINTDKISVHQSNKFHQCSIHYCTTSTHLPFTPAETVLSYIASQ